MCGDNSGDIKHLPIAIDLDGTLVGCNSFTRELKSVFAQGRALRLLLSIVITGSFTRAQIKERVAALAGVLDYTGCFAPEVVSLLEKNLASKTPVVIATGASALSAEKIIMQLNIDVPYIASNRKTNLIGKKKAETLVKIFGQGRFAYVGDSRVDFFVFEKAKTGTLVTRSSKLILKLQREFRHIDVIEARKTCTH